MPPRAKKDALTPEDQRRLMEEYDIYFDGPLLPSEWPPAYAENFKKIRQIGQETYEDYGKGGRLNHRLTVLPSIPQIKRRANELRRQAYRCRRQNENEATWRRSLESFITAQFSAEVVCRRCRKRFWDADFQAAQTDWMVAAEDLRQRRARRVPCTCSNDERMTIDVNDRGASLLFTGRSDTAVVYHSEDRLIEKGVAQRKPDLVFGLDHTAALKRLLPDSRFIQHSPFKDGLVSYPFLLIEAKSEKGSPGFESVERQSAFPIRTLVKLQKSLQGIKNVPISPLVWFMANQGDEWRVYACILDGTKYRIIDLWHGCMLSLDSTLQILLIADHICDWARDVYRVNVLHCLSGSNDVLRDETPLSTYREEIDPNLTLTAFTGDESSMPRNLNFITRRTHSLSLEPAVDGSGCAPSQRTTIENDYQTNSMHCDENHPYMRFCRTDDNLPPWRQNATIRHANMVLFSFHLVTIPEEPSDIMKTLALLGSYSGLASMAMGSRLLELLAHLESVTVTMNAIHQLETTWTGQTHQFTSLGDYPVRARVLFHTYLREDWQIVREIHCITASRFAIVGLLHMLDMDPSMPTSGMLPETLRFDFLPDMMTTENANIRALRRLTGSDSLASALRITYFRLGTERSQLPDNIRNQSSWTIQSLDETNALFDLEKKLAYHQACNPTSLKFEALQHHLNTPSQLRAWDSIASDMERSGAVLIKKPSSWTPDSPDFCLIILDDTPFTDLEQLGEKLSKAWGTHNIYVTGIERRNGANPLSEIDQIAIKNWINILHGWLPETYPWPR